MTPAPEPNSSKPTSPKIIPKSSATSTANLGGTANAGKSGNAGSSGKFGGSRFSTPRMPFPRSPLAKPSLPRIPFPKIENKLPATLIFYCKDCHKIVEATPIGRKFVYKCNVCQTKNVAFGSVKSIKNFYRIKDEGASKAQDIQEEKRRLQQEM